MKTLTRTLFVALLLCAGALAGAWTRTPWAGHYRADMPGGVHFHLRVAGDGSVELLSAQDGSRIVLPPQAVDAERIAGVAPTGETWSIERSAGGLVAVVGEHAFGLRAISEREYAEAAQAGAGSRQAANRTLGGQVLTTASSSSGGYHDRIDYLFCSDGSFARTSSIVGPGVSRERVRVGRWGLRDGTLHLTYDDGDGEIVALRRVGQTAFSIDGTTFVASPARRCR